MRETRDEGKLREAWTRNVSNRRLTDVHRHAGIVLTNDGNAILREIDVVHPAAKSMIDLSRTQDEEVGDGTTSVIILAGELLRSAEPLLEEKIHPTVIVRGYVKALEEALRVVEEVSFPVDVDNREEMQKIVNSCVGTKYTARFGNLIANLALDAVLTVVKDRGDGTKEIDVKQYAKVEKIPGGRIEDSCVLDGVMFNKDVVVPSRMKRKIENPRILLMDCPLEFKKGESQTNVEMENEDDFAALLKVEEEYIEQICDQIASFNPDLVITEKGLSDLAAHFLYKRGVSAIRRLRKTDNNRIARACGATIVSRTDEIRESDIGTRAGLFEVRKLGDEYFTFIEKCTEPKACSIILRGASKDVLNEIERNLHDALGVSRNVVQDPKLVPGGGAVEMAISRAIQRNTHNIDGPEQLAYKAVGTAVEVIPRTLIQNCGANVIRTLTKLRAKHAEGDEACTFGINGLTGIITDMKELGVWEPCAVKTQTLKTAVESACMLLRIDDIVSGLSKNKGQGAPRGGMQQEAEEVDSERALPE